MIACSKQEEKIETNEIITEVLEKPTKLSRYNLSFNVPLNWSRKSVIASKKMIGDSRSVKKSKTVYEIIPLYSFYHKLNEGILTISEIKNIRKKDRQKNFSSFVDIFYNRLNGVVLEDSTYVERGKQHLFIKEKLGNFISTKVLMEYSGKTILQFDFSIPAEIDSFYNSIINKSIKTIKIN